MIGCDFLFFCFCFVIFSSHMCCSTLTGLLENDEDMFMMNLSRLWADPGLIDLPKMEKETMTDDVEILLEAYVMNCNKCEKRDILTVYMM